MTVVADREVTAATLLKASAEHSFDPWTQVDWDQPPVPGAPFACWHHISLYGTGYWDELTDQQRCDLSRHELASVVGTGLWFELILMQMLLRHSYDKDPRTLHVTYALTEIADECRHSMMFARLLTVLGTPAYRPKWHVHNAARLFKAISTQEVAFAGTLVAEELTDGLQREVVRDASVQPLVHQVTKIHVAEEARHVRYAREEVLRLWPRLNPMQRPMARLSVAVIAYRVATNLIHKDVYVNAGLDPHRARRAARRNPAWRASRLRAASRMTAFLCEAGVIPPHGPSRWLWRRAWLLP